MRGNLFRAIIRKIQAVGLVFLACTLQLTAQAQAGNEMTVDTMIEQLQRPRTRSLRNLSVGSHRDVAISPNTENSPGAFSNSARDEASPLAVAPPSLSLLVHFDFDSAQLRQESIPSLETLASALQSPSLAGSRFAIEGHTDAKGQPNYNRRLSERRAEAVRAFLVERGIEAHRLVASGKGASDPANPKNPFADENRRVRIINLD